MDASGQAVSSGTRKVQRVTALKSHQAGPPATAATTEVTAMESYQMAKWKEQVPTVVDL